MQRNLGELRFQDAGWEKTRRSQPFRRSIIRSELRNFGLSWTTHWTFYSVAVYEAGLIIFNRNGRNAFRWDDIDTLHELRFYEGHPDTSIHVPEGDQFTYAVFHLKDNSWVGLGPYYMNNQILTVVLDDVAKHRLPAMIKALDAGETIDFGGIAASKVGLTLHGITKHWIDIPEAYGGSREREDVNTMWELWRMDAAKNTPQLPQQQFDALLRYAPNLPNEFLLERLIDHYTEQR